MYTLKRAARRRVLRAFRAAARISSTPRLVAASTSSRSTKRPASISVQARAFAARLRGDRRSRSSGLGENARERCLADAARAGEEIGVVQALLLQRVRQRRAPRAPGPPGWRNPVAATCGQVPDSSSLDSISGEPDPRHLQRSGCGCFLPDLTRFTGLQCGEARRLPIVSHRETPARKPAVSSPSRRIGGIVDYAFPDVSSSIACTCGGLNALRAKALAGVFLSAGSGRTGGESGIRTHGTLLTYTRFPSVRLKPLGHLSAQPPDSSSRMSAVLPAQAPGITAHH